MPRISKHWLWRENWLMVKVSLAHLVLAVGLRLSMHRWLWKLFIRPSLFAFTDAEGAAEMTIDWLAQLGKLERHIDRFCERRGRQCHNE